MRWIYKYHHRIKIVILKIYTLNVYFESITYLFYFSLVIPILSVRQRLD
nr:MAG TPA: hypothetical protein [Caudoviricetes sp.]